jgi:hypothetical protein
VFCLDPSGRNSGHFPLKAAEELQNQPSASIDTLNAPSRRVK